MLRASPVTLNSRLPMSVSICGLGGITQYIFGPAIRAGIDIGLVQGDVDARVGVPQGVAGHGAVQGQVVAADVYAPRGVGFAALEMGALVVVGGGQGGVHGIGLSFKRR